jgi:hypothetical protein
LQAAGVKDITLDLTLPDLIDTLAPDGDVAEIKARLDAKDAANVPAAFAPLIAAAGPVADALDRLRAFDTAGDCWRSGWPIWKRLSQPCRQGITVTLDPTERHGFEYQTWLGFSLFSPQSERRNRARRRVSHRRRSGVRVLGLCRPADRCRTGLAGTAAAVPARRQHARESRQSCAPKAG